VHTSRIWCEYFPRKPGVTSVPIFSSAVWLNYQDYWTSKTSGKSCISSVAYDART